MHLHGNAWAHHQHLNHSLGEEGENPAVQSASRKEAGAAGTSFRTEAGATLDLARLFVILSTPHFFLNAASFYQFAEAANRLLNRFAVAYDESNHSSS
jgi:hypothetical protein